MLHVAYFTYGNVYVFMLLAISDTPFIFKMGITIPIMATSQGLKYSYSHRILCMEALWKCASCRILSHIFTAFHMVLASLVAQLVKNLPAVKETLVQFLLWEDPLEMR